MPDNKKLIDVYPYRVNSDYPEFLLMKRSANKIYQGQWRMVGGKVEEGETYWQAALRELEEETSLPVNKMWSVPSLNNFYEIKTDSILLIPAFAVEISQNKEPVLDDEHTTYAWQDLETCEKLIIWPEQKRLLRIISQIVTSHQIADEWIVQKNF